MTYEIRPAKPGDARGIAETIVEGFYQDLKALTKSKKKLLRVLEPAIQLDRFFVAEDTRTGTVVGAVGLSDLQGYSVQLKPDVFKAELGPVIGSLGVKIMSYEINRPGVFGNNQGQIDFVCVRHSARGHGLAEKMINRLFQDTRYAEYTLDVVEGNERALALYERVGFRVVGIEKEIGGKWFKNFSYRYLMRRFPVYRE